MPQVIVTKRQDEVLEKFSRGMSQMEREEAKTAVRGTLAFQQAALADAFEGVFRTIVSSFKRSR